MYPATLLRFRLIFEAFLALLRMLMTQTYPSERWGATNVRHAVSDRPDLQSIRHKLCRETISLEEKLHASRSTKWGNPRSSFIWSVFSPTTEDLSEHLSDVPINKLLEKLLFSDRCHPLSRSEPVHL